MRNRFIQIWYLQNGLTENFFQVSFVSELNDVRLLMVLYVSGLVMKL